MYVPDLTLIPSAKLLGKIFSYLKKENENSSSKHEFVDSGLNILSKRKNILNIRNYRRWDPDAEKKEPDLDLAC